MSADEYWNADPYLAVGYRKAHEIKQEIDNQMMWLQGIYNYKAHQTALDAFGYALGGCKGPRPEGYLQEPIPVTRHEKEVTKQKSIAKTLAWFEKGQADGE